jgi:gliding motility-associated-like protein
MTTRKAYLFYLVVFVLSLFPRVLSQTFSPITVSGFNIDAVAEVAPNALSTTSQALDAVATSNTVLYSVSFGSSLGFGGGLPNSGTIVNGTRTYQLMPYTGNNAIYVQTSTTKTITLTSPASYSKLSLLLFSTEGTSNISINVKYTDLTTTSFGSSTIADWFGGTPIAKCCLGRCARLASVTTSGGLPSNPNLYYLDLNLSCADQLKNVASIVVTGNTGSIGSFIMGVSGVPYTSTTTLSYPSSIFCGSTTFVTATLGGATTGAFSASPGGLNLNPTNGVINALLSAPGTYTVTFMPSVPCASGATFSLTIAPSPIISISSSPISTTPSICYGQTATLTASGATTYSWSTGATSSSIIVSPTTTTTYSITGIASGCSAISTLLLNVTSYPTISITSPTICNGNVASVSATGATSYTWNTGATASTLSVSPSNTTTYSVIGNSFGCTSINTTTVFVNPSPTITVNSATLCAGETTTISAIGATSYSWSTGATINTVTVSPSSSTIYTVLGESLGCTTAITTSVNVTPLPTINVNSATLCVGQSTVISASGASSYIWNTGETTNSINVSPTSSTVYTVIGTTNGCSNTALVSVTTSTVADVSISSTSTLIPCNTNSIVLTANSLSGGSYTYNWQTPIGVGSDYAVFESGTYTVIATNSINGCTVVATQVVDQETVIASFIADTYSGLSPLNVSFVNTSTSGVDVGYSWDLGNSTSTYTTTNCSSTYINTGAYSVTLIVTKGFCVDTASTIIYVDLPSGLIAPNVITPNGDGKNDVFYLDALNIGQISMFVFDRWGLKIFDASDFGKMSWDGKNQSGNTVSDGVYYYVIKATGLDNKPYELKGIISVFK